MSLAVKFSGEILDEVSSSLSLSSLSSWLGRVELLEGELDELPGSSLSHGQAVRVDRVNAATAVTAMMRCSFIVRPRFAQNMLS